MTQEANQQIKSKCTFPRIEAEPGFANEGRGVGVMANAEHGVRTYLVLNLKDFLSFFTQRAGEDLTGSSPLSPRQTASRSHDH